MLRAVGIRRLERVLHANPGVLLAGVEILRIEHGTADFGGAADDHRVPERDPGALMDADRGLRATWYTEDFAELGTAHATLAIGSTRTAPLFAPGAARPADNHTVIIEFLVDDVDGVHQNLAGFVEDFD